MRRKIGRVAAGCFLAFTTTAVAFFVVVTVIGEGTSTLKVGAGGEGVHTETTTVPAKLTLPEGLTPGKKAVADVTLENTANQTMSFTHIEVTFTDTGGCKGEWFVMTSKVTFW